MAGFKIRSSQKRMEGWNGKIGNEGAEVKQIWVEVKATFLYNVISFNSNMLKTLGLGSCHDRC